MTVWPAPKSGAARTIGRGSNISTVGLNPVLERVTAAQRVSRQRSGIRKWQRTFEVNEVFTGPSGEAQFELPSAGRWQLTGSLGFAIDSHELVDHEVPEWVLGGANIQQNDSVIYASGTSAYGAVPHESSGGAGGGIHVPILAQAVSTYPVDLAGSCGWAFAPWSADPMSLPDCSGVFQILCTWLRPL